ncbi:MAG: hypothetical protein IJ097_04185 [Bacilli bacterium]|nr:hypothetical protein [Bacilli bacterium]
MKKTVSMALIGGMAVAGIIYFMKNPGKFKLIKDMEVDAMNKMNQLMDDNK